MSDFIEMNDNNVIHFLKISGMQPERMLMMMAVEALYIVLIGGVVGVGLVQSLEKMQCRP